MKKIIKDYRFKIIFAIITLIVSLVSVCAIFFHNMYDAEGHYIAIKRMTAFTCISNVVVFLFNIYMVIKVIKKDIKHPLIYKYFKIITSIMIGLTFIVFAVILTPGIYIFKVDFDPWGFRSLFNHWIVPLFYFPNIYFINNDDLKITFKESLTGIIPPVIYYFTWMIVGSCLNPKRFQYPFMDYTKIGWLFEGKIHFGVIPFFVVILAMLLGLIWLHRYLNNKFTTLNTIEIDDKKEENESRGKYGL